MTDFYILKKTEQEHWYKEPWMLLVLGGPLIVVIASLTTFYIAWQGQDQVISKDYYKQGINIDKDIQRDAKASEYNMTGTLQLASATGKIILNLQGENLTLQSENLPPASVLLTISSKSHTANFEAKQKVSLSQIAPGIYEGWIKMQTKTESNGIWYVKVEAADWRLTADWTNPLLNSLQLKAQKKITHSGGPQ